MNPLYRNNEIRNHLDERLVDCFCEQNVDNRWLQVSDIASWIFETNNPNSFQKNYTLRKLNSLVGPKDTAKFKRSAFEAAYDPEVECSLLYRLKDPKAHISRKALTSLSMAVDGVLLSKQNDQDSSCSTDLEEFPF